MPQVPGFAGGIDAQHYLENSVIGCDVQLAPDQFAHPSAGKPRQIDGLTACEP